MTTGLCLLPVVGLTSLDGRFQSFLLCVLSVGSLAISSIFFNKNGSRGGWDGVVFSIAVFSVVAGVINPIKCIPGIQEYTVPVVMVFDLLGPTIAGAMNIAVVHG